MDPKVDLTGKVFERLTIVSFDGRDKNHSRKWLCSCSCGSLKIITESSFTSGRTKSCGCLNIELIRSRSITHGKGSPKNRLYRIWSHMKRRCYDKNYTGYKYWGGKGVEVCEEWMSFEAFDRWAMSNGYSHSLSLDRIRSSGHYTPDNCRWATRKTQNRNRSISLWFDYNGESRSLADWADVLGIKYATLLWRSRRMPFHEAATRSLHQITKKVSQ